MCNFPLTIRPTGRGVTLFSLLLGTGIGAAWSRRFETASVRGIALVARLDATPSHNTVQPALAALAHLEHRGASGADADTGDGAGILLQIPDALFRGELGAAMPAPGSATRRSTRRSSSSRTTECRPII